MSLSKAHALTTPANSEAVNSEPHPLPGRRAPKTRSEAFLDSRLIVGALGLGGLLAGSIFGLGSLLPTSLATHPQAVVVAKTQRPHKQATLAASLINAQR